MNKIVLQDYCFGSWLKYFREKRKISIEKLSFELGLNVKYLDKLEKTIIPPPRTYVEVENICKGLKLKKPERELLYTSALGYRIAEIRKEFNAYNNLY